MSKTGDVTSGDGARAELDSLNAARAAGVEASMRPAWVDAIGSLFLGLAIWLASMQTLVGAVVAVVLLVGGALLNIRFTRRRGTLTDDRAVGATILAYAPLGVAVGVAGTVARDASGWVAALAALAVAVMCFVYLRGVERYQVKRLARGDYGPYDLS